MTLIRRCLVGLSAGILVVASLGAQPAPSCDEWNTDGFFVTATVEDVTGCLNAGADVAARDDEGQTPLYRAAAYNENPAVVEALLAAGADPAVRYELMGYTPLHAAASYRENPAVVEALLAAGANLEARSNGGDTPLNSAISFSDYVDTLPMIETLLAAGADANTRDDWGDTPLHNPGGSPAVVQALLMAGASLEARDEDGNTPLHARTWNPAVVEVLLAAGSDVHARDVLGNTPLHEIVGDSDPAAAIEMLLAAGGSLEARNEDGNTPLHAAAAYSRDDEDHAGAAIEALLDAGANATARNARGETPWDVAAENEALKGSDAYWRLNDARFNAPEPDARRASDGGVNAEPAAAGTAFANGAASGQPRAAESGGRTDAGSADYSEAGANGGPCLIPDFPNHSPQDHIQIPWCTSGDPQVESFAGMAAVLQCTMSLLDDPEQIRETRRRITEMCERLDGMQRLGGDWSCQCPPGFGQ